VRKPNFFILGAPKCGTTSLAAWLAEHPDIYMSPLKEPFHFNTDHAVCRSDRSWYEALFTEATDRHLAVGEATPMYLYSDAAVPNILEYVERPLFIVCIRNPVDMAYSLHDELLFQGTEHIADFALAWSLNEQRMQGKHVTHWCREPKYLCYSQACLVGAQVERFLGWVPRTSVHFVVLDDVAQDTRQEYLKALQFLGVADDGRMAFPVLNRAKRERLPFINRSFKTIHDIRRKLGITRKLNLGIQKRIEAYNRVERTRPPMLPQLRCELQHYFYEDVVRLGKLLGRDLSGWVHTEPRSPN
jgi:hypothetical protein